MRGSGKWAFIFEVNKERKRPKHKTRFDSRIKRIKPQKLRLQTTIKEGNKLNFFFFFALFPGEGTFFFLMLVDFSFLTFVSFHKKRLTS